ncbi:MAG: TetR/AcrR family transcriptional regulator [Polyangiaceae bacterium]
MTVRRVPNQQRAKETVDAVFEAALRELSRDGEAKLSVNRVAETAGVSIGSLYQYFPNKESLLTGLIARFVRRRFDAILELIAELEREEQRTGERASLEAVMTILVEGTLGMNKKSAPVERALVAWFARVGSLDALAEVDREATTRVAQSIRRLKDTPGRIRDVDPDVAAHVLVQSIRATILTALLHQPTLFDDPALSRELVVLATRYLAP